MIKNLLPYILVIIGMTVMTIFLIDYEKEIEELNYELKNKSLHIDSLKNELYLMDSTYRQILDSLPIGPPLDTIIIQDNYTI